MQPDIDRMDIHQLRTLKDELVAQLNAAMSRINDLEMIGYRVRTGQAALGGETIAEPEPGPNAHPEGEDAP